MARDGISFELDEFENIYEDFIGFPPPAIIEAQATISEILNKWLGQYHAVDSYSEISRLCSRTNWPK